MSARNPQWSRTWQSVSGVKEPKLDHFHDVKQALHKWLLKHDPKYRENSAASIARNAKVRAS